MLVTFFHSARFEIIFKMYVIAQTEYGQIRGVKKSSALDIEYISFYSIPYATPPLGELRFKVGNDRLQK